MKRLVCLVALLIVSCAKTPPSLSPTGARYFQADRGVVAIGNIQHVALELNRMQVCSPAPCHPLLTDANTRIVVDASTDALVTIKAAPQGWKTALAVALDRIKTRLDVAGNTELAAYLNAARLIMESF